MPTRPSTPSSRKDKYFSAWATVVVPMSTLAATPILLDRLGADGLGLVFVALALSRIAASLDLGTGGLAIPRSADLLRGEPNAIWSYLGRAIARLSIVTAVLVAATIAAVAAGVRLLDADGGSTTALLLSACVAALALQMFTLVNAVLYAASEFRALAAFATVGALAYLLAIVLLVGNGDETLVLIVTAVQYVLVAGLGVARIRSLRRPLDALDPLEHGPTAPGITSVPMQVIALGGVVVWQAPTLIASVLLDPTGVTSVGIGQQYASVVRLAGLSFAGFLLSRIALAGDTVAKRRRADALNRRWLLLCAAGTTVAVAVTPVALPVWLGDVPSGGIGGSALAAFASAMVISSLVGVAFLRNTGQLGPELRFVVALLGSTLVATPIAMRFQTPTGVWAAFAVSYSVVGVAFSTWTTRLLRTPAPRTGAIP